MRPFLAPHDDRTSSMSWTDFKEAKYAMADDMVKGEGVITLVHKTQTNPSEDFSWERKLLIVSAFYEALHRKMAKVGKAKFRVSKSVGKVLFSVEKGAGLQKGAGLRILCSKWRQQAEDAITGYPGDKTKATAMLLLISISELFASLLEDKSVSKAKNLENIKINCEVDLREVVHEASIDLGCLLQHDSNLSSNYLALSPGFSWSSFMPLEKRINATS